MWNKISFSLGKVIKYFQMLSDMHLIRTSGLFDAAWYLANNPDVANAKTNPILHYLRHGGFERRNPGPDFYSDWYLDTYKDVKQSAINPLVHYLRYGQWEGRAHKPQQPQAQKKEPDYQYGCSVCGSTLQEFLPLPSFYEENLKKYGWPFTFDDAETINPSQYSCPKCGASDRDRLYAVFLSKVLNTERFSGTLTLLDFAPSLPLREFLFKYPNIRYLSADKYMQDVDITTDITEMIELQSDTFDIFICSHVLEHVADDARALSELFRILKPGGFGILMVPIILSVDEIDEDPDVEDIGERWRRFGQDDHVRLYSKNGFLKRVKNAGFVIHQYGIDVFGREAFIKYGISPKSILYVVEKNN